MQRRTNTTSSVGGHRVVVRQIGTRPLYLGNQYAAGDDDMTHELVETFAAPGVPVLSLGGGDLPLTTHHHPIHDGANDQARFNTAMDTACRLYREVDAGDRPGPMLVNCAAGISRSTTAIATILTTTEAVSFETAVKTVQKHRECADPHPSLVEHAATYLDDVPGVPPVDPDL
jgi:atypical dual specificity phosphatase